MLLKALKGARRWQVVLENVTRAVLLATLVLSEHVAERSDVQVVTHSLRLKLLIERRRS